MPANEAPNWLAKPMARALSEVCSVSQEDRQATEGANRVPLGCESGSLHLTLQS